MVTIFTVLSLVIAFCRRCWRSRTGSAAAEHRRKRRRVPKKNKKAAVTALIVLFIAGAADRCSTLVAEAATLPTEFGSVNIADITIALTGNAYTGTIPSQLGYMVDATKMNLNVNEFTGAVPTELGGKVVLSTCTCIASYLRLPALTISVCVPPPTHPSRLHENNRHIFCCK